MDDFECLVVDDCSFESIGDVVSDFDDRFRLIRSKCNLGPTGARYLAFEQMQGDALTMLDSDDELYPWALARAVEHLRNHSEVGGVTGLWVFPDGLRVRVQLGEDTFTPIDYTRGNFSPVDCVGFVRRPTVESWLSERRRDYFAAEIGIWLAHRLKFDQLYVDEPWGRKHYGASTRVTNSVDPRKYRDAVTFVEEFRQSIGTSECVPIDNYLQDQLLYLLRAGRWREANTIRCWMRERHIPLRTYLYSDISSRLSRLSRLRGAGSKPILLRSFGSR
jgi:glycosyltransferase involved in cell wall biosynthesis